MVWQTIKGFIVSNPVYLVCGVIWIGAWTYNAIKGGVHFDLDKLTDLYKWLFGMHSVLNTPIPAVDQMKKGRDIPC